MTTTPAHRAAITSATLVLVVLGSAGCDDPSDSAATSTSPTPPTSVVTTSAAATTESTSPSTVPVGVDAPGLIAFRRYTDASQQTSAIWTIRPDGTGERQITHPPVGRIDDQPAISADGARVAYEYCVNGADDSCHVIVADIDGSHPRDVSLPCPRGPVCDTQAPAWAPDGRLVVNRSWGKPSDGPIEHSELVVADADGSHPTVVATSRPYAADLERPVWSPDGSQIAYEYAGVAAGSGRVAVRVLTVASGRSRQVTPFSLAAGDGVDWTPDGRWLVFHSNQDSSGHEPENVVVIHPDGTGQRDLTHFAAGADTVLSSSFSPDGRWVVYAAQATGGQPADLYLVRLAGGDATPLTQTPEWDSAPEWGPSAG